MCLIGSSTFLSGRYKLNILCLGYKFVSFVYNNKKFIFKYTGIKCANVVANKW